MCTVPSKYKMLLHNWIGSKPNLVLKDEQLSEVDKFGCMSLLITPSGITSEELSSCILNTRLGSIYLKPLWRPRDIRLSITGRVHSGVVGTTTR